MHPIRDLLKLGDPYAQFDPSPYPPDPRGWGSDHPFFRMLLRTLRPSSVIEVGTWKGGSALHMARVAREMDLDLEIVCVDTWLGSFEHLIADDPDMRASLRYVHGYPTLYFTFLSNVIAAGLQDMITPFPMPSDTAAQVLSRLGARAGFIYIDAGHDYASALRDMTAYWDLLTDDGCMLCDDYGYSEVTEAACQFAANVHRPLYASYGKAIISKRPNRAFQLTLDAIAP